MIIRKNEQKRYTPAAPFNKCIDMIFQSIGIEIKRLPPFTPIMNSRMENFIRAIKTECLDKIIFTNELERRVR